MKSNDNFNRIVEMNTEAERRMIAAMAMQGIMSNPKLVRDTPTIQERMDLARAARVCADTLIAELNKNKKKDGSN